MAILIRTAFDTERGVLGALKLRSSLTWGDHVEDLRALPEAGQVPLAHMPHVVVAELQGQVVGFATMLAGENADEAELEDLFVAPEHWRTGVGGKLLAEAERRAARNGARTVRVIAGERARSFYEASGYRYAKPVATDFELAAELRKDLRRSAFPCLDA